MNRVPPRIAILMCTVLSVQAPPTQTRLRPAEIGCREGPGGFVVRSKDLKKEGQLMTAMPTVVSAEEWEKARAELLAAEKAATREQDRIAAQRRRLPMVEFGEYTFAGPDGPV